MSNPLLDKVVIQPIVRRLPSSGLLYEDGELDSSVTNGEIEIYPLTGMDDIKMKSPDMMLSGKAMIEVIGARCPQVLQPEELFIQDADYITFMMRIASYGDRLILPMTHRCEDVDEDDLESHEYNIDLSQLISKIVYIEPSKLQERFTCELSTGHVVKFKPVRLKHIIELANNIDPEEENIDKLQRRTLETIAELISSVDSCDNRAHIVELLEKISAPDYRKIEQKLRQLGDWGISYTYDTKCKSCNADIEIPIDTNPLVFFTES